MPRRICFPFVGDSVGGSHLSAILLISHLDRSRYEPLVVLHQAGPLAAHLHRAALDFEILPFHRLAGELPRLIDIAQSQVRNLPALLRFLSSHDCDAVHTNDLRTHLTWAPAARLSGRRFIWHQRVLLSTSPLWSALALAANHVICISRAVFDTLPRYPVVPTSIVANAVASPTSRRSDARDALLAELNLPPTVRLIGFVGNMTRQKRPQIFLETAARLHAAGSLGPIAFLLFGDDRGGELARMRDLTELLGIVPYVRFMGYRAPIEPCIAGLDLLLAPGVGDGFGRTLAEAMSTGTPVVAAASAGHIEIIEDGRTGLLVPPDDVDAFVTASFRLLANEELLQGIATNALEHATRHFCPTQHADRIAAVYDQVFGTTFSKPDSRPSIGDSSR